MADRIPKKGDLVETPQGVFMFTGQDWLPADDVNSGFEALQIGMGNKLVSDIANTPAALGDLAGKGLAAGTAAATTGARAIGDLANRRPLSLGEDFSSEYQATQGLPGFQALQNLPRPPDDIGPRVAAGVQVPFSDDPYSTLLENEKRRAAVASELWPGLFRVGEIGADATAIAGMRKPIARRRGNMSRSAIREFESNPTKYIRKGLEDIDPNMRAEVEDVVTDKILPAMSDSARLLKRAGVKAGEAGLEGAYLAALNSGDPLQTAVLTSATSAIGSAGLQFMQKPARNVLVAFAGAFVAHEILKAVGPGAQDFFASKDFAIQSVVAAGALGLLGGLVGAGRLRGGRAANSPYLADAVSSVPRTVTTNLLESVARRWQNGDQLPYVTIEAIANNPTAFNENQLNSLTRAMRSKREDAFPKEVERLMEESPSFRRAISDILSRRTPPEGAEFIGSTDPVRNMRINTPTHPIERGSQ